MSRGAPKPVKPILLAAGDIVLRTMLTPSGYQSTPVKVKRAFSQPMVEVSFPDSATTLWVPASEVYPATMADELDYWRRAAKAMEKAPR